MTGLTDDDKRVWRNVTRDIKPLDNRPVSPVEDRPRVRVTAPRSLPYDPVLDLHGLILQDAFQAVQSHIIEGAAQGYRRLTIITGRSGQMNQEMPRWVERNSVVRSINSMNGGGAWEILIKRNM